MRPCHYRRGARELAQQKQRDAEEGRRALERFSSQLTSIGAANNRDEGVEVRRRMNEYQRLQHEEMLENMTRSVRCATTAQVTCS